MKSILLSGVALSVVASGVSALAADMQKRPPLYTKAPAASPIYNWTGCYLGVQAGAATASGPTIDDSQFSSAIGGLLGGQAGCDRQYGQIVVGVEGEGAWSSVSTTNAQVVPPPRAFITNDITRNRWSADAAVRVGVAVDRALVYGKVGAAWGRFEFPFANTTPEVGDGGSTLTGLLLGAGLEYAFAPHWSAMLEFDHVDYANHSFQAQGVITGLPEVFQRAPAPSTNTAKVGLNYRFGDTELAAAQPARSPLYTKAAPASAAYDWTGCYLGAHAGGGLVSNTPDPASATGLSFLSTGAGGLAGGQAGCDHQVDPIVFGIVGEGAWSGVVSTISNGFNDGSADVFSVRNRWAADVALRGGVALDRVLVYGKVGGAWGDFTFSSQDTAARTRAAGGTLEGLLLGGGIEYAFAPHWSAALEFDHVDYVGRVLQINRATAGVPLRPFVSSVSATTNVAKAALNYRFADARWPGDGARVTIPVARTNWTGCYVGVHAGGGTMFDNFTTENGIGGLAGGQAGCDRQFGQIVVGAQGEGSWSGISNQFSSTNPAFALLVASTNNRWSADAAARAGLAVDRALVYGKVGAAWGRFDFAETQPPSTASSSGTLPGLLLGGGIEYAFAPQWSATFELDHVDYVNRALQINITGGVIPSQTVSEAVTTNVVKAGINYRFGGGPDTVSARY